jgi:hypothetical protein
MESIGRVARSTTQGVASSPRRLQNHVEIEFTRNLTSVQNSLSSPAGIVHAHAQRNFRSPNYGTNTIVVPSYKVQICAPQVVAWDHDRSSDVTSISEFYNRNYIDESKFSFHS